ncbi:hypothetical protein HDV00_001642 [Rhizophlyctis rosea]|nr:hypothetical protein HDV00_001642 [Rhizophlyctis rosea]
MNDQLHINNLPRHVLEAIFTHLQPPTGLLKTVYPINKTPNPETPNRPIEIHLAQVCALWRDVSFTLRNGDCLNPLPLRPYGLQKELARPHAPSFDSGFHLLLNDPKRVAAVRTLTFRDTWKYLGPPATAFTYKHVFNSVDVTKLRQLTIGDCVSSLFLVEFVPQLLTLRDSLCLREFDFTLKEATPAAHAVGLANLLFLLQHCPLTSLALDITLNHHRMQQPWIIPLGTARYLEKLWINHDIIIADLAAAAPNLKSFTLFGNNDFRIEFGAFPPIYLTHASLKKISITDMDYTFVLQTIPATTLRNVAILDIQLMSLTSPHPDAVYEQLAVSMSSLESLKRLTLGPVSRKAFFETWYLFPVERLPALIKSLPRPEILVALAIHVQGWDTDAILKASSVATGVDQLVFWVGGGKVPKEGQLAVRREILKRGSPWFQIWLIAREDGGCGGCGGCGGHHS